LTTFTACFTTKQQTQNNKINTNTGAANNEKSNTANTDEHSDYSANKCIAEHEVLTTM